GGRIRGGGGRGGFLHHLLDLHRLRGHVHLLSACIHAHLGLEHHPVRGDFLERGGGFHLARLPAGFGFGGDGGGGAGLVLGPLGVRRIIRSLRGDTREENTRRNK